MAVSVLPREEVVEERIWRPNSRWQEIFLASRAQIVIGGGAAGGGKTEVTLMDPLRFIQRIVATDDPRQPFGYEAPVPGYQAVIFRRLRPHITNEGGLWDSSMKLFGDMGYPSPVAGELEWRWPWFRGRQCTLRMTHLQYKWSVHGWHGAQIPYIGFDEMTQFDRYQILYMMSRNRSDTGIQGLIRGGCNPDPDSFVAELIKWWIDHEEEIKLPRSGGKVVQNPHYGYAHERRAGVVRWFVNMDDKIVWAATRRELYARLPRKLPGDLHPRYLVKSLTFVPFKSTDNPDLMRNDPHYIGNLMNMDLVERERLLGGNWTIRPAAGKVFPKSKLKVLPVRPPKHQIVKRVRFWDKAASEKKGSDWSVGLELLILDNGLNVIADVVRDQWETAAREEAIANTAAQDGLACPIVIEMEPASGGKDSAFMTITQTVPGFDARAEYPTGDLYTRARPFSRQWQVGNVAVVAGEWNEAYIREMDQYDGKDSTATKKDDQVSASAGAYNVLMTDRVPGNDDELPPTGSVPER